MRRQPTRREALAAAGAAGVAVALARRAGYDQRRRQIYAQTGAKALLKLARRGCGYRGSITMGVAT